MTARDFFDEVPSEPTRAQPAQTQAPTPPAPEPAPAAPMAPAVVFHAVSEHDAVIEEGHRPVRRRRPGQAAEPQAEISLQMVETQAEASVAPLAQEDEEPPRRSRPRRRRGVQASSEPLMMVETQPGAEPPHADGQP
jgi:hypothetical protein